MATATESGRTETIVIQHYAPAGVLAGALACIFGLLGIFFIGLIFVPLAAICAIVGLVRGIGSGSGTAIGLSIIGGFLCIAGFVFSPSLWVLFGVGLLASLIAAHPASSPTVTQPHVLDTTPPAQYSVASPNPLVGIPAKASALILSMQRFDNVTDEWLKRVPNVETRYHNITSQMSAYYEREKGLVGNPDANVQRSQLAVRINQGQIATDQLHMQIQSQQSEIENQIAPLGEAVSSFKTVCNRISSPEVASGPWKNSCIEFLTAQATAAEQFAKLKGGLGQLEKVYLQEQETQNTLINASQQIE